MKRCKNYQIYSFVVHVVLDNPAIQGTRKSFRVKDTQPEKYQISGQTATHILKSLCEAGIIARYEKHPRKWLLSEYYRMKLARISSEQRKVILDRIERAVREDLVFQLRCDKRIHDALLESLELKE